MPDEIAELRELLETAMVALAAAEDDRDAAIEELNAAQDACWNAQRAAESALEAEVAANRSYLDALKRHGYKQTASGPMPKLRAMSTDPATGAKVITPEDVRAQRPHYQPEAGRCGVCGRLAGMPSAPCAACPDAAQAAYIDSSDIRVADSTTQRPAL